MTDTYNQNIRNQNILALIKHYLNKPNPIGQVSSVPPITADVAGLYEIYSKLIREALINTKPTQIMPETIVQNKTVNGTIVENKTVNGTIVENKTVPLSKTLPVSDILPTPAIKLTINSGDTIVKTTTLVDGKEKPDLTFTEKITFAPLDSNKIAPIQRPA
jgi:hypothetical protein